MARPKKIMTPGELRSAKAVLKQELKTYVDTVKTARSVVKSAQADKAAAVKAAAKTLAEATKAHDAAVKAAIKAFEAVNKVQGKVIGHASTAGAKTEAKLTSLEGASTPAPALEPAAAAPTKRGRKAAVAA